MPQTKNFSPRFAMGLLRWLCVLAASCWGMTLNAATVAPFTMVIKTDNPGSTASNAFVVPLADGEVYDFTVTWSDGTSEIVSTTNSPLHVYASPGTYPVT
ncbi:MAG TPA: hypothetical protein VHQ92_16645, partial [Pseudolabrys sp.]|nr:hypothetical protein [Pseudolabrys sp.]